MSIKYSGIKEKGNLIGRLHLSWIIGQMRKFKEISLYLGKLIALIFLSFAALSIYLSLVHILVLIPMLLLEVFKPELITKTTLKDFKAITGVIFCTYFNYYSHYKNHDFSSEKMRKSGDFISLRSPLKNPQWEHLLIFQFWTFWYFLYSMKEDWSWGF